MVSLDGNALRPALMWVKGRLPGGSPTSESAYAPCPMKAAGTAPAAFDCAPPVEGTDR